MSPQNEDDTSLFLSPLMSYFNNRIDIKMRTDAMTVLSQQRAMEKIFGKRKIRKT